MTKEQKIIEQNIEEEKRQDKTPADFLRSAGYQLTHSAKENPAAKKRAQEFQQSREQWEQANEASWYKRMLSAPISKKKLPFGMKIFGVLCTLGAAFGLVAMVFELFETIDLFVHGKMDAMGLSSIVVAFVYILTLLLLFTCFLIFGIRLLRDQRVFAAFVIYAMYVLMIVGASCSLMLFGVSPRLIVYGVLICILIAFQIYLDPQLREERQLHRMLRDKEIKKEQEDGTLGRDKSGKGFIDLNFFNLFWIFVIASFAGDIMESIVHVLWVDPGHWQDRAGLLFGQFSPIYGFGALLMTLFLNRIYKQNLLLIFLLSAIIGGAFEFMVSLWMQYTYGAVAWNYTGQWLSIGGRTCGWAMCAWGALGVVWIKLMLPGLLWLVNKIPWNWRYTVTGIAAAFMLVDCVMTLESLDCWYERLSGDPINTPIQHFYADYFDNDFMANRFQSMTIDPHSAVRGGKA